MTFHRIMLKLSREIFSGEEEFGIRRPALTGIAEQIAEVSRAGTQVAVTVGGGNIWRYRDTKDVGIERTASDAMGMLATIMNAVALQSALESLDCVTRVMSAVNIPQLAEPFIRRRAIRHLEKGRIVLCAGGTGNPYFTTDSAAALRALELHCDVLLKGTNVDGVYDKDPHAHPDAEKYDHLTYQTALEQRLRVMDQSAFSLCHDQNLPIVVFNFAQTGALRRIAAGEKIGTTVSSSPHL